MIGKSWAAWKVASGMAHQRALCIFVWLFSGDSGQMEIVIFCGLNGNVTPGVIAKLAAKFTLYKSQVPASQCSHGHGTNSSLFSSIFLHISGHMSHSHAFRLTDREFNVRDFFFSSIKPVFSLSLSSYVRLGVIFVRFWARYWNQVNCD